MKNYRDYIDSEAAQELLNWEPTPAPQLTIELVPKTCWYSNVRSNVPKEHWDVIRKLSYTMANYMCEICFGVGSRHPVECHEVWNYDDENHVQTLERMISLCPSCHEVKHIGRAQKYGGYHRAVQHLSHVNGWDHDQSELYVAQQFLIWHERSQHDWKLDLRGLDKYTKHGKVNAW